MMNKEKLNDMLDYHTQDSFGGPLADIDNDSLRGQKRDRYRQNTTYRCHLTRWVMLIVPIWLSVVYLLLLLCGFGVCKLSDVVLSTLLATTTVNILGLAYIVLKGMFPQEHE